LFRRACCRAERAGQFGLGVLAGAGLVDRDGPAVGGALVAQAQDGRGLAVAGQERGDVAVLAAVADEGLAEAGPAGRDVGDVRAVTALRVCWSGVCGTLSMMAGAPAVPGYLLTERIPADAPGCRAAGPGVADEAAGRVLPVVHRAVVPHVQHAGLRFPRPVREAHGVRQLTGAGLSRIWPHDRAHYLFARARWNPDDLGIAVAKLVIGLLVPAGETVEVLIDDTLFRRRGKRVWAASWFHDGAAQGPAKTGYGNNWVVLAVRAWLPVISRPVAIPVMAKLVIKDTTSCSRLWLARRMVTRLAAELPGREINVTADSAYAGEELKQLPDGVTWTTRLRANAALCDLPPARTGKKGRPPKKGNRLPALAKIAAAAAFWQVTVTRYGKTETIAVHAFTCLWYSATGTKPVTVILIRDKSKPAMTSPWSPRKRTPTSGA
jgi:hypothetical protein